MRLDEEKLFSYVCPFSAAALLLAQSFNMFLLMAFVPVYNHDVFVSYAHIDDEPLVGAQRGWVTTLINNLEIVVRQKLGAKDLTIWMDHDRKPAAYRRNLSSAEQDGDVANHLVAGIPRLGMVPP